MCGISAIVSHRAVNTDAITAMTEHLRHRGPEYGDIWVSSDERVALGHRRLAIIDPTAAGNQPMHYEDLCIVYNGEIYNYIELRAELSAEGYTFQSSCDTEVILAAYAAWGQDCVQRLNGMFAFVIHDPVREQLFCARDRFGEKPFLFAPGDGFIAIASEYRALLSLAEVPSDWDPLLFFRFLQRPKNALDDSRETLFPAIHQLLPAEMMVVDLKTLEWKVDRYWDVTPDPSVAALSYDEAVSEFRALFMDSVRLRLRSDRTIGANISGGLDSGSIVSAVKQVIEPDRPFKLYTARFPGTPADEWPYAKQVIEATGFEHSIVEPRAEDLSAEFEEFCWHHELPVHGLSQYAQWCLFRCSKDGETTVILDGSGGDELLGGFEQYYRPYLLSRRLDGADGIDQERAEIQKRYPLALANRGESLSLALPNSVRWQLAAMTGKGSDNLFGFNRDMAASVARDNVDPPDPRFHPLTGTCYRDALHTNLPSLLRAGDRGAAALSREIRLPFCDHRIAEFTLSLPADYLMGDVQTKRLLRDSMKGLLPEGVRSRWNKQGMLPPQADWFRDVFIDQAQSVIEDPEFAGSGFWNVSWWRSVVNRFRAGDDRLASVLWTPLTADGWRRYFLERIRALPKISCFRPA